MLFTNWERTFMFRTIVLRVCSNIQGGSNMTLTDFCVNKPRMSWSCLNHLVIQVTLSGSYSDFYIHRSVHRNSILTRSNKMQQYAGIHLLQNHSTCFGCLSTPSSGVHQTVTAASGACHICQRGLIRPSWQKVVALILWPVPEALVSFIYSWWWVR